MAHFSFLVLASTGLAVSAPSTAPVLKLLLERALRFPQAKEMERFTAYLAEDKLHHKDVKKKNKNKNKKGFKTKENQRMLGRKGRRGRCFAFHLNISAAGA